LTLIKDIEGRDRLLRIVYDWNWRAAVSALRETQAAGRSVSEAMEAAVLSMAAEKLFDPVEGTTQHVRGQLGQFPVGGLAAELRGAADHPTLLAYVERLGINGPAWFDDWTGVFLRRPPKDTLTEDDIVRTTSEEPLLGWTTANTIRRFDGDPVRSGQLRALYLAYRRRVSDSRADTVRWRIVHALGRWPTAENAALLQRALAGDTSLWVRYGAVRSLMEMAALAEDTLRDRILRDLRGRISDLDPEPLGQIAWSALYRDARPGWPETVRPLIEAVLAAQDSDTGRQRWQRRLDSFNDYASKRR
jgi:hypothetical protein